MNTTVVIVSYKSDRKIYHNLDKFDKSIDVLIIENSKDLHLKSIIEKKYKNVKVKLNENKGFAQGANLGAKLAKSKYIFFVAQTILLQRTQLKN